MNIKINKKIENQIGESIIADDYGEYVGVNYEIVVGDETYHFRTSNRKESAVKDFISDLIIEKDMVDELNIPEEEFINKDFEEPFDVRENPSDDHIINSLLKSVIERHIQLEGL